MVRGVGCAANACAIMSKPTSVQRRQNQRRFGDFPQAPEPRLRRREGGPVPSVPPSGAQTLDMEVVWESACQAGLDARYHVIALRAPNGDDTYVMLTQEFGQGIDWRPDSGILIKADKSAEVVQLWGTALQRLNETADTAGGASASRPAAGGVAEPEVNP